MSLSSTVSEKANLIWAVADKLTGSYKPHEYGLVTLPMTVIKRFDCILEDTKDAVLKAYDQYKDYPNPEGMLKKAAKQPFYNISKYTLKKLLDDPDHIEANFRNYLNGYSLNVQEILAKFNFDIQIKKMAEKGLLYQVVTEFTTPKADLHPEKVSNLEMGYIFEELVRRFSESHNEDAGQHYTPREVIELMANILFAEDEKALTGKAVTKTIYDPACGTGGMLSVAKEYLSKLNADLELLCYGQELNDETFAICKADVLIKGGDADNIKCANTLSEDQFSGAGIKFDYILSNPPFGREWKNEKAAVEREFNEQGYDGRFGPGLPGISDSQMLFLETVISKMKPEGGRAAIIHNGSPLFTGDAGSGPSEIRKYILETDLLDCIIALPNDIFYNTGIATYIWVLSNKKPAQRHGKVQLINASQMFEKRRKSLGNKRNDIPPEAIREITKIYGEFRESDISKIFDTKDFGYKKIVVERPLKDECGKPILKKGKKQADSSLRDTENVPLKEDVKEYFRREVLPFAPDAWIDESKTKTGYEIPFTRYFYKYEAPRKSEEIMGEILALEAELDKSFKEIFR